MSESGGVLRVFVDSNVLKHGLEALEWRYEKRESLRLRNVR